MRTSAALALALAALGLAACSKPDSGAAAAARVTPAAQEAFKMRCAPCHGEAGRGDGPGAAALNPKPRNYTDATWQKSVKDEDIKKTILYGGAAVGKSAAMPGSPDLEGKPELDGLVAVVRSFGSK